MAFDIKSGVMEERGADSADILPSDIPDIDLYLDQVAMLLERKIPGYSERPLTKAMINNYSRENLIRNVKGKKYTRVQIVQMMIVYNLKQALGIQEIRKMFDFLEASEITYERCYMILLEEKENGIMDADLRREAGTTRLAQEGHHAESPEVPASCKDEELLRSFLFCALKSMDYKKEAAARLDRMSGRVGTK